MASRIALRLILFPISPTIYYGYNINMDPNVCSRARYHAPCSVLYFICDLVTLLAWLRQPMVVSWNTPTQNEGHTQLWPCSWHVWYKRPPKPPSSGEAGPVRGSQDFIYITDRINSGQPLCSLLQSSAMRLRLDRYLIFYFHTNTSWHLGILLRKMAGQLWDRGSNYSLDKGRSRCMQ